MKKAIAMILIGYGLTAMSVASTSTTLVSNSLDLRVAQIEQAMK